MVRLLSQKVGSERFRYFRHCSVVHLVKCTGPINIELVCASGSEVFLTLYLVEQKDLAQPFHYFR